MAGQVLDSRACGAAPWRTGDALVSASQLSLCAWPLGAARANRQSVAALVSGMSYSELSARGADDAIDSDLWETISHRRGLCGPRRCSPPVVRPSAMTVVMMRAGRPCRWRWRGFVDSACLVSALSPDYWRVPPFWRSRVAK